MDVCIFFFLSIYMAWDGYIVVGVFRSRPIHIFSVVIMFARLKLCKRKTKTPFTRTYTHIHTRVQVAVS